MMNRRIFIGLLYAIIAVIVCISFYADFRNPFSGREVPGFDGRLRLNEAEVLRMGINPFDILSGKIYPPKGYVSGNRLVNRKWDVPPEGNKEVHTYTPWSYSLVLPFTFINRTLAGRIFWLIDTLALMFIIGFAFFVGERIRNRWSDGLFVAVAAICLGNPFPVNSDLNNYSTVLVAAVICMCWCLNKKKDVLAGLFWAVVMIKPHFGILFGFPIVIQRRWKTLLVALGACLIMSMPASFLCRTNPLQMCLNVIDKNGAGFCFQFTGFFPAPLFKVIANIFDGSTVLIISAVLGVSVMLALLWRLRKSDDFFVLCLPIVLTIPMWLYSQYQDAAILCIVQMVLAMAILNQLIWKPNSKKVLVLLSVLLILNASRVFISGMVVAREFGAYDVVKPIFLGAFHICKLFAYIGCVVFIAYLPHFSPDCFKMEKK